MNRPDSSATQRQPVGARSHSPRHLEADASAPPPGWRPPRWSGWLRVPLGALALVGMTDVAIGRIPSMLEYGLAALVVGLIAVGVVSLRAQAFGPAFCRQGHPSATPRVALTFDDGPDPNTTPLVLEALGHHRATFFVVGEKARAHPELIAAIRAAGHQIASHGERHSWRDLLTPARASRLVREGFQTLEALGIHGERFFRPPYGLMTPPLAQAALATGLITVGWSRRSFDTLRSDPPGSFARKLASRIRDGDIVLLHDAPERQGGHQPLGVAATGKLIRLLEARGFEFVTVRELQAHSLTKPLQPHSWQPTRQSPFGSTERSRSAI